MKRFLVLALFVLTGCDSGFQTMEAGEYGVVFSAMPTWLGGGVRDRALEPGEMEFIFPWQKVYRLDTTLQSLGWGGVGEGSSLATTDYVETRTQDGNEVGLAMNVQYHVDPKMVGYVVQHVGTTEERIRQIVAAVALADIRTHMNTLRTSGFFNERERQAAVDQVKKAMDERLRREGIIIDAVIYVDRRFERALPDGTFDRSYQQRIDDTQATDQETQQERKKIATVIEQKKKEYNEELARVNRAVQEAEGEKKQAVLYADSFLEAKKNEAAQVTASGINQVEALRKRIEALAGPGGEAFLRLELVQHLMKGNPKFVLLNSGNAAQGGLDLTKVDANELVRQLGIITAVQEQPKPQGEQVPAR